MSTVNPIKLSLTVQYASNLLNLPTRSQLRKWVRSAMQSEAQITLRIVDEPEGRELNKIYRGKDYATNVLTFAYENDAGIAIPEISGVLSGDIVICAPVVAREAAEQNKEIYAHYAHLAIHAVLHMQGYRHDDEHEAIEMESLETSLMLKLRYPDPYGAHQS